MKTRIQLLLPAVFTLFAYTGLKCQAPLAFTLKEAQDYAYNNNYDLKNSLKDVEIAKKMVKQNTAIGLPQIDATVDYMDYIETPTTIIPNFLAFLDTNGTAQKDLPMKFGLKYNLTAKAQLNQLVYSGQYLVGLQTAKAYLETARQKYVKDNMDVRDIVSEAYISVLIVRESVKILDSTESTLTQMVNEAKVALSNGLMEDIDVDQLELNLSNLEAQIINIRSNLLIAESYLRFVVGLKEDQKMVLTDNLDNFITQVNRDALMATPFDYNHNIDYTILKKQEYLILMQYKLSKTAYQPTLGGFFALSENAQRDQWNFFSSKYPWYQTVNWGLHLAIPIWSSGSRKYSVDQARLNYEKIKVTDEKTKTALNIQAETVRKDFNSAYLVFLNMKKGLETSQKIYNKTIIKYKEGVSTSTDLNQRYNQFLGSESAYIQSLLDLLKTRIKLSRLLEKV
jgi:outer membrane protein